jgi:hypothetical protein
MGSSYNSIDMFGNTLGIPYTDTFRFYQTSDLDSSLFTYHLDSDNRLMHETHVAPLPISGEIEIINSFIEEDGRKMRFCRYQLIFEDGRAIKAEKRVEDQIFDLSNKWPQVNKG